MRWVFILLIVVGIGFIALMLIGSNEQPPPSDGEEPPPALAFLNTGDGAPRLVEDPIAFPRDSGEAMGLFVPEACGTPARLATVELTAGNWAAVSYRCNPAPDGCRGAEQLCVQVVCLVTEATRGTSSCPSNREVVGRANLSIGPESGRITIAPPPLETAGVTLR